MAIRHRTGISHLWRLVNGLCGKQTYNSPNKGVRFADKTYLDPKIIANKFAHQFTPPPIRLTGDKSKRQLKRQFHQLPLTKTPSFSPADTKEAIRLAKSSTAIVPDGMSTLQLKKIAQGAINYLTNIFNLSISTGHIHEIWHKAIINLKPDKDNNIGKKWRPISLLCPAAKTLEKLLLPKILTHIPFHPAQHAFRPKHSTCTALSTITADIAAGFSRKKPAHRTVLVALDLTAAFDNVDHQQLLDCIFNTNIPSTIRRWLKNYMQNRRAKVLFRQTESRSRRVMTGVVQGGVLPPALCNHYLADYTTPPPNIKLIKYADDITIYTSGPAVADLINGLKIYLSQVLYYINNKKLSVSTAKSTVTLFMLDTHENHLHLQVKLADQVLPSNARHDLTFTQHCNNIAVEVQQRNNMLKVLAGTTWGCVKETLLTTYQASGSSILSYCSPVWTPSLKDINWCRLQRAKNSALRISTGCLKMVDVSELHREARELPVRQHNELISQQFAMACHQPQHPCHQLCHRPTVDRQERRRSLIGRLKPNIQQCLAEGPLSNTSYKSAISSIHQDVVRTINKSSSSRLPNGRPPPIATAELTQPRKIRTILAQLRTGYCRILGQYMNKIDPTVRNHCHNSGHSRHQSINQSSLFPNKM